jgi:SAM-dependent methyltransferase
MKTNKDLKGHYNEVYKKDAYKNYYTFAEIEGYMAIIQFMGEIGGKRVLEIGCGQGELASMISYAGPEEIVAVDFSSQAIETARKRYNLENVSFQNMDYRDIKDRYDIVVLHGVLEHFDKPFEALEWILESLVEKDGFLVNLCPSFLNIRGHVWMTLQLLLDVPMSLSDLHFLCPFDFEEFCEEKGYVLDYVSTSQDWGSGEKMIIDFDKRLRNALRDANMDNSKVDKLLEWLRKAGKYSQDEKHTGAVVTYKIHR